MSCLLAMLQLATRMMNVGQSTLDECESSRYQSVDDASFLPRALTVMLHIGVDTYLVLGYVIHLLLFSALALFF